MGLTHAKKLYLNSLTSKGVFGCEDKMGREKQSRFHVFNLVDKYNSFNLITVILMNVYKIVSAQGSRVIITM